ncbi:hypothetical protein [Lactobacillus taiwanensis]|uniref:hypothetical protein n=1 Tax=Lactobacillus taiwanensis TaxID=508451 RepID=UPI000B994DB5|nr:hypothetical protein [Lactobacillus taiwanensis]MCR1916524.1 hypothetical protein [Lactobacillus taiwanensis]OYR96042.1 hypothetical protein CBF51_06485 [Lactobacillus taiwanensis]OYR98952.1 hypothetical protein CBF61_09865 [Lactobacillus taiwanensis]OYS15583.1 hypothetical protein CBF69_05220 [Lactobacillus taiwanensis]OYS20090.1 hypothetical protein CBF56_02585 [Lactobacillus taiwanensis]
MNKKKNNNVELTIKPDNDTEVKIDIKAALEDLGLTTEKTDDATLLDKLGASVGINSCSYNRPSKG